MTPHDIASIGTLILLEALLSADNALVLALIARRLPDEKQRDKALNIGIALSFLFRAVGLLLAKLIINFWFIRALGAGYLLYLAISHFREKMAGKHGPSGQETATSHHPSSPAVQELDATRAADIDPSAHPLIPAAHDPAAFRKVVIALTFTDIAFAVDSILAAVAITDKLWVIYLGVLLGIVALRLVASAFIRLLERFPAFGDTAYVLVAWAGAKLGLEAIESFAETVLHQHWAIAMDKGVFWVGMAVIIGIGTFIALRRPAPEP